MKKSIKRITGWVTAIFIIVGFIALKNSGGINLSSSVSSGGSAQTSSNDKIGRAHV